MESCKRREDESMRAPPEEVEEKRPLFRKNENQPSNQEVQEHMKTHIPHRSWCAHCITRRERNDGPSLPRDRLRISQGEQP